MSWTQRAMYSREQQHFPEFMALKYSQQTPNTITRVAHARHNPGALS